MPPPSSQYDSPMSVERRLEMEQLRDKIHEFSRSRTPHLSLSPFPSIETSRFAYAVVDPINDLFQAFPQWYTPLLLTLGGHEVLAAMFDQPQIAAAMKKNIVDHTDLVQFCLALQAMVMVEEPTLSAGLFVLLNLSGPNLFQALRHYIHPDQADELTRLRADLPPYKPKSKPVDGMMPGMPPGVMLPGMPPGMMPGMPPGMMPGMPPGMMPDKLFKDGCSDGGVDISGEVEKWKSG